MGEFVRDPFRKRAKPNRSEREYRAWGEKRTYCYLCGGEGGYFGLTTHHIVKQGRSHDATNLIRLCMEPCHSLAEMLDVRGPAHFELVQGKWQRVLGELLPKLGIGICLTLKQMHDPEEVDLARLQELRGSRLPDPEPVPEYFVELYSRRRGAA